METNVRYTVVGVFVVVITSAIVLGIIWLSMGFSIETYTLYKVEMKESVSGLSADGAVEFNGVNVGTVKSIRINPTDPKSVELLLRVASSTPITEGTRASMNMRGLTGVTFMSLRDIGDNEMPLRRKAGEDYPIIQTAPSLLTRFDLALTELNDSLRGVSESIQKLLSKENLRSIQDILTNVRAASFQLSPFMQSGADTMDLLRRQTLPAANEAILNLDNTMRNLSIISSEMQQNPAILIRGKAPVPLGPGEK